MDRGRDRISRAAALLKEASSFVVTEEPTDMIATRPNMSSQSAVPNSISRAVNSARQMLNTSSRAGVFTRLNRNERLRSCTSSSPRPLTSQPVRKKPDVAIEFGLIEAPSEETRHGQCLKWDSVIASGIVACNEYDSEKDIRVKIRDSLCNKFSLFCADDFEFVKVRHKRISKPALQAGAEFNYTIVKKLAGHRLLYLQLKPECKHSTEEDEIDSKSHNECRDNATAEAETQTSSNRKGDVMHIDEVTAEQTVDARDGNHDSKAINVFTKPPPAFDIQPLIDEGKRESCMEPIEILRSMQKKLHKGRDLNVLSSEDTTPHGEPKYISIDRSRVLESRGGSRDKTDCHTAQETYQ